MRTYLLWSFGFNVLGFLLRMGMLAWSDYPRETAHTRGADCFMVLATIACLAWSGVLLWA